VGNKGERKPVVTYEVKWVMSAKDEVLLNTRERSILRKEYGPVTEQELTELLIYITRRLERLECDYNGSNRSRREMF
jgi:hypothetical protein